MGGYECLQYHFYFSYDRSKPNVLYTKVYLSEHAIKYGNPVFAFSYTHNGKEYDAYNIIQFIQEMYELSEKDGCQKIKQFEQDLEIAERRISEIDNVIMKLFEQNALGKISDERFEKMSGAYENERKKLSQKRNELKEKSETRKRKLRVPISLINNGLLPISISPKSKYRQALKQYNKNEDTSLMEYIVCKEELNSFEKVKQLSEKLGQSLKW